MMNKKLLFGILTISIIVIVVHYHFSTECHLEPFHQLPWVSQIQNISLYDHGKVSDLDGIAEELAYDVQRLNLQAACVFPDERIDQLKQEGKVVEVTFREPVNITISQWIGPEDRSHIPTNASGYRILTNIKKVVVFVLEGDYEGHVYVKGYGCWAILKDDRIDKNWISKIEKDVLT